MSNAGCWIGAGCPSYEAAWLASVTGARSLSHWDVALTLTMRYANWPSINFASPEAMRMDAPPRLMEASPWINFRVDRISSYKLSIRGREILAMFAKRGIQIEPGNRLERAIRLTETANSDYEAGRFIESENTEPNRRLLEAFRTLWDALVVMHTVVDRPQASGALSNDLLAAFLSGADLPLEDANPYARNTQFEAYVGATLVLSGLSVTRAQPDFRMQFHGREVGVAVKRLTSTKPAKVYDRLREATHQLRDASLNGFAALNLDPWVTDLGDDPDPTAVGALFNQQLEDAHEQLDKASERPHLLGVIIIAHWSRFVFGAQRPELDWRAPTQIITFTETEFDVARMQEFFGPARARLENSLRDIERLIAADS